MAKIMSKLPYIIVVIGSEAALDHILCVLVLVAVLTGHPGAVQHCLKLRGRKVGHRTTLRRHQQQHLTHGGGGGRGTDGLLSGQ